RGSSSPPGCGSSSGTAPRHGPDAAPSTPPHSVWNRSRETSSSGCAATWTRCPRTPAPSASRATNRRGRRGSRRTTSPAAAPHGRCRLVGGAVPDRPALIGLDLRLRRDLGALQLDPEGGAATLGAGDADAAAMLLHDGRGDREAEPRAAALGRRAHP